MEVSVISYTPERAESIDYSTYAEGTERYWIYTREEHEDLADGDLKQMYLYWLLRFIFIVIAALLKVPCKHGL